MATNKAKPPTVRLRRLAATLRRLRENAGLSREDVETDRRQPGHAYRLETARSRPQPRTLKTLLNLYGVSDAVRADLLDLAKNADAQGWLRAYQAAPRGIRGLHQLRARGAVRPQLRVAVHPRPAADRGLREGRSHGTLPTATSEEVGYRVRARMERQERLTSQTPLEVWGIADEAAIRRQVGGSKVMRDQLARLVDAAKQPNVTLQVIPVRRGRAPRNARLVHLYGVRRASRPDLVYVDTLAGDLFLETDDDLRLYGSMFDHLRAIALSPSKTTSLITEVMQSLKEKQ